MNNCNLDQYQAVLLDLHRQGQLESEILRHEASSAINRHQLTKGDEGLSSFNTNQLAWMCLQKKVISPDAPIHHSLLISCMIDGNIAAIDRFVAAGYIPEDWQWFLDIYNFNGTADDAWTIIQNITDTRDRAGASCLLALRCPSAVTTKLCDLYFAENTGTVYLRLVQHGLTGDNAQLIADKALSLMHKQPAVLYAIESDSIIADCLRYASDNQHENILKLYGPACGDHTAVARARRQLESGKAEEALQTIGDIRFLSDVFPQAAIIGTLARVELGQWDGAAILNEHIEDTVLQLKIKTRIAQAQQDLHAEMTALLELQQCEPNDPSVFAQLLSALQKSGNPDIAKKLCYENQERFLDEPIIMQFINQTLSS